MTERIKEFSFCTCIIKYDVKRSLLFIDYLKKGQLFYSLTITNFKKTILKNFFNTFDENSAKEVITNNISIL
jgi:hypothetical protein